MPPPLVTLEGYLGHGTSDPLPFAMPTLQPHLPGPVVPGKMTLTYLSLWKCWRDTHGSRWAWVVESGERKGCGWRHDTSERGMCRAFRSAITRLQSHLLSPRSEPHPCPCPGPRPGARFHLAAATDAEQAPSAPVDMPGHQGTKVLSQVPKQISSRSPVGLTCSGSCTSGGPSKREVDSRRSSSLIHGQDAALLHVAALGLSTRRMLARPRCSGRPRCSETRWAPW